MHNLCCTTMIVDMEIDLVTAVQLAGLALTTETLRRLRAAGHPDLRTAHGYLIQHVVEGPRSVGEIAARMRITQQAVSKSVGELVGLGYLERTPAADDARVRLIGLSDHGRAAVAVGRGHMRIARIIRICITTTDNHLPLCGGVPGKAKSRREVELRQSCTAFRYGFRATLD